MTGFMVQGHIWVNVYAFIFNKVLSVEYYCKVNPACFKCLKMINSWKHSLEV